MIHASAIVGRNATIGHNVRIGPFTIVYDDVVIGDGTEIGAHCEIGHPSPSAGGRPLVIGVGSLIRSHSIFYQGSTFGAGLTTGHRVTVRENVTAGAQLQIGTLGDFQGDTTIGDHVRTHSNVHISKHSVIGNFVWVYPYVVTTNDPHPPSAHSEGVTVADYAVIATMSVILPGVTVGRHSLVAAHSLVNRDVPAHTVVGGVPAKEICKAADVKLRDGSMRNAYPWPAHFHRGYPDAVVQKWRDEFRS